MPTAAEIADEVFNRRIYLADGNYLTVGQAIERIARFADRTQLRNDVHDAVWVNPQWTVPGTTRLENPGRFLSETRVAAVQAANK